MRLPSTVEQRLLVAASLLLAAAGCSPAARSPAAVVVVPTLQAAADPAPAAPAEEPRRAGKRDPDKRLEGTWDLHDSSAVVRIRLLSGQIHVEAWDSADGKTFNVEEVKWDGQHLSIRLLFPPTQHRTDNTMLVIDQDTLEGERSGGATGHMIWRRMSNDEVAASKPPPP